MPTFDNQDVYNKHQVECGCEDKSNCGCESNDCGCCPPGLVGSYDDQGNFIGCVTPTDYACIEVEGTIPPPGYVKVYSTGDSSGTFIGIMSNSDAIAYYESFGIVTPAVTPGLFNAVTVDTATVASVPPVGTNQVHVDFQVDRISCLEAVVLTLGAGAPAGMSFFGSATSTTILASESILDGDGIEITDAVAPGVYPVEIVYTACSNTVTRIITVTVT